MDAYGPLLRVELAAWLWLVPALPLIFLALATYLALSAEPSERTATLDRRLQLASLGAFAAAVAVLAGRWGHEATQLCHVFRFVRVGRIDASFDLVLDTLSAALAVAVCLGSSALALVPASADRRERLAAYGPLVTAGALIVALSDNVPTALLGGLVASVGAALAAGVTRALYTDRLSDACLLVGAAALAWSFGGGFAAGEFTSDMNPRLVVASSTQKDALEVAALPIGDDDDDDGPRDRRHVVKDLKSGGKGSITVLSPPGSMVFVDDSHTPLLGPEKEPLRVPLVRYAIGAGVHVVRVRPAEGVDDTLLPHVVVETDRDTRIAMLGPSTSLRELSEELGLRHLMGDAFFRDEVLGHEAWPGARLSTVAAALLALGLFLRLAAVSSPIGALAAFPWLVVAARTATLLSFVPAVQAALAIAAFVSAVFVGARAARGATLEETIGGIAGAKGLFALGAIACGATAAGVLDAGASLLALAVLVRAARSSTSDAFAETVAAARAPSAWSLAWTLAAFALGFAPSAITALAAALGLGGVVGAFAASAGAAACGLVAYALLRAFGLALVPRGKPRKKPEVEAGFGEARSSLALAVLALAAAVVLGVDTRLVGGEASLAARLSRDVTASMAHADDPTQGTLIALALVWLGLVAGAGSVARTKASAVASAKALATLDDSRALASLERVAQAPSAAAARTEALWARWMTLLQPEERTPSAAGFGLSLAMGVLAVATLGAILLGVVAR